MTDWGKVNIEALRQHLIDMDNVTLHAEGASEPIEGSVNFTVSGTGAIREVNSANGHGACGDNPHR